MRVYYVTGKMERKGFGKYVTGKMKRFTRQKEAFPLQKEAFPTTGRRKRFRV